MAFRFKQFSVEDDKASMKVGTDAVLLGAWAGQTNPKNILDIGCGSGLLSLMMAQRYPEAKIHGIDIHTPSVEQALDNFNSSQWSDRLQAQNISLQEYTGLSSAKYELIISNPPFFNDSLLPPEPGKAAAKHTHLLSFNDMARCVYQLLEDKASFALILPALDQQKFELAAKENGLYKNKEMIITPVMGKKPNRILSAWGRHQQDTLQDLLTIRTNHSLYTEKYIQLTRDFYLAL